MRDDDDDGYPRRGGGGMMEEDYEPTNKGKVVPRYKESTNAYKAHKITIFKVSPDGECVNYIPQVVLFINNSFFNSQIQIPILCKLYMNKEKLILNTDILNSIHS